MFLICSYFQIFLYLKNLDPPPSLALILYLPLPRFLWLFILVVFKLNMYSHSLPILPSLPPLPLQIHNKGKRILKGRQYFLLGSVGCLIKYVWYTGCPRQNGNLGSWSLFCVMNWLEKIVLLICIEHNYHMILVYLLFILINSCCI